MFHILFLHFCSDYFAVSTDEGPSVSHTGAPCAALTLATAQSTWRPARRKHPSRPLFSPPCCKSANCSQISPSAAQSTYALPCAWPPFRSAATRRVSSSTGCVTTSAVYSPPISVLPSLSTWTASQSWGLVDMLPICTDLPLTGSNRGKHLHKHGDVPNWR